MENNIFEFNEEKSDLIKTFKNKFSSNMKDFAPGLFTRYNVPEFKEESYKDWINYGRDNLYSKYLVGLMNKSATHNAIVQTKAKQIAGEGWNVEEITGTREEIITKNLEKASILKFINQNAMYDDFNTMLRKIGLDQQVFGFWYLGIIWSQDRTKIARIYHIDASQIRVGRPDEDTGEVTHYYYSKDWKRYRKNEFSPRKIAAFNPSNRSEASQILMIKKYRPDTNFYGVPEGYIGALNAIELEYRLSNFQLNSVMHGLAPSMHIAFNNGNPTPEEKAEVYNSISALYAGDDNSGRFFLTFNESKDNAPIITPIETSNLHEIYTQMAEFVQEQIVVGSRITSPSLVGIKTAGELGGGNNLAQDSELFFTQYIGPEQIEIEDVFNRILHINGFNLKIYIKDSQPISYQFEPDTLQNILTINEMRAKIGYTPITKEEEKNIVSNANAIASAAAKDTKVVDKTETKVEEKQEAVKPYTEEIGKKKDINTKELYN